MIKTTNNEVVLACRDLTVGYKNSPIIENVNLELAAGHFITLLGPNGAGKTTLLRTLSRHLEPLDGTISLGDRPLEDLRQGELARIMAVVLTDKVAPPLFSSFDFVALGRYPHTNFLGRLTERDRMVVEQALRAVHAGNLAHRDFSSLSDGEKQKVLVARALAQEPKVLLLDEPTAHLDLKHRVEVMAILRNLCHAKNITVIASLHDVDIAAKVSDRVALVKGGAITAFGYPEEVLSDEAVSRLYDFDSACFNHQLGSIELRGNGKKGQKIFVVAGMGSGAVLYRLLAKRGYDIATGVLHSNDLDCFVAESLGARCASQPPADSLNEEVFRTALEEMRGCELVIDAGFAADGAYAANRQLLDSAAIQGKPVFSLRSETENDNRNYHQFQSAGQLLDAMEVQ